MGRETSAKSAQTLRGKSSNAQARWRGSRNEERIFAPRGAFPLRLGYPGPPPARCMRFAELRTPVVGRVNQPNFELRRESEEDHATNLIYIEIFKIGVDPLSEAAVVKTRASSAGTREPSARRIDVD